MNEDLEEQRRGVHSHPNSNAEGNDVCLQVACCVESGRATHRDCKQDHPILVSRIILKFPALLRLEGGVSAQIEFCNNDPSYRSSAN